MSYYYIKKAQEELKKANLYKGDIDGDFGKGSYEAVVEAISSTDVKEEEVITPDRVTTNFTLGELTHSNTAVARGISNEPIAIHKDNLIEAANKLFQPVRDLLGHPMVISSGYRSEAVNKAVGGSSSSAHSVGYAIDFSCKGFGSTTEIAKFLVKELYTNKLGFDQLILEFPDTDSTWIHLGYKSPSDAQRHQVLTAKKVNGRTMYYNGLV